MIAGKHSIAAALAAAIGVMALSKAALAQALTFELNGTRFYLPRTWTITPVHSRPAYQPKSAPPENTVFKVDRSIMLGFPHVATHPDWSQRYPEIAPPFVYELMLEGGSKELQRKRWRSRVRGKLAGPGSVPKSPDRSGRAGFAENRKSSTLTHVSMPPHKLQNAG